MDANESDPIEHRSLLMTNQLVLQNMDANNADVIVNPLMHTTNQITRNIIVFGATGAGKSSVINMICGGNVAQTSNTAIGCTFKSSSHHTQMKDGLCITLWDTAGLDEGERGTVSGKDAIVNLYKLIRMLNGGVCLLVYCMRGPRINERLVRNYKMFYSAFCLEKVPIVLVVTGLEEERNLDDWWSRNETVFHRYEMVFSGHACITATKGKEKETKGSFVYEAEYESSVVAVRKLVSEHCLDMPWRMETRRWVVEVLKILCSSRMMLFDISPTVLRTALTQVFKEFGGSSRDASQLADEVQINRQRGFFFFLIGRRRWPQTQYPQQNHGSNTETQPPLRPPPERPSPRLERPLPPLPPPSPSPSPSPSPEVHSNPEGLQRNVLRKPSKQTKTGRTESELLVSS